MIIEVVGKEIEKIKGDFESYLNGLNMVGEISYSQYSELYDEGTKQIQKAYELGKKANEWHFVKDGDYPKENEYIMIYSKLADNVAVGKRRCAGKIRKRCVYEWYFATYEATYCLRDKDVIAWKEIVLPELKEKESN